MKIHYDEVEAWLVERLAELAGEEPASVDIQRPFIDYSLDSSVAVTLSLELGRWMDAKLSPTLFWEYPNIATLAAALTAEDVR
jgi:acyl carrier protein